AVAGRAGDGHERRSLVHLPGGERVDQGQQEIRFPARARRRTWRRRSVLSALDAGFLRAPPDRRRAAGVDGSGKLEQISAADERRWTPINPNAKRILVLSAFIGVHRRLNKFRP